MRPLKLKAEPLWLPLLSIVGACVLFLSLLACIPEHHRGETLIAKWIVVALLWTLAASNLIALLRKGAGLRPLGIVCTLLLAVMAAFATAIQF